MLKVVRFEKLNFVALLTEGVDRNMECITSAIMEASRPPRGGRG